MKLSLETARSDPSVTGVSIFLSASIPDAEWRGDFAPLEITDAVVAMARVFLTAGARIVTAAHPTIAPLLLYTAAELPPSRDTRVVVYQSRLYEGLLPEATLRFEVDGIGDLIWTPAVPGDRPEPGRSDASLDLMRRRMLQETRPSAAAFVGGMAGIRDEFRLFTELFASRPTYPIGRPGGEARTLAQGSSSPLRDRLVDGSVYPSLWRAVLDDLRSRL
jgi:hypothetical protein